MDNYSLYEADAPALEGFERELFEEVASEEPWALVEEFATLGRVSGSPDEQAGAEYLTDRLDALGIDYERYDPTLPMSIPQRAVVRTTAPSAETFGKTDFDGDFFEIPNRFTTVKPELFSASGTVSGEIVYLDDLQEGDDMFAPVDIGDRDLGGKIALVELLPLTLDTAIQLQEAGAAGIVCIHPHERKPHWGRVSSIPWGNVAEPGEPRGLDIQTVTVSRPVGDRVVELATGKASLDVELDVDVVTDWFECPIVVADVPGRKNRGDDFVLLHGHHDSWDPGVIDNATGDAGLLECARVFHAHRDELRRDLRIAWWPGHSQGSYAGSSWYADEFALDLEANCVAHVNMDAPGAKDATEFDSVMWMPEADEVCQSAIRDVAGKDSQGVRPIRGGDYSFNNLGVTGLFMLSSNVPAEVVEDRSWYVSSNPDAYHIDTNTIDKADPAVLVRDIRVHVVAISRVLTADVLPFDHRHTLERHRDILEGYAEDAGDGFDLGPVTDALSDLEASVGNLYDAIDAGELNPAAANRAITDLSRTLVRLNFASEGRFEQDPTTVRPPYPKFEKVKVLPSLEDADERRALETHLRRRRNAVEYALRRADRRLKERLS